jgi:hypothetical protein
MAVKGQLLAETWQDLKDHVVCTLQSLYEELHKVSGVG